MPDNEISMEPPRSAHDQTGVRARAFELIKRKSFSRGDFVLTSGKTSKFYLDMKPSMFDAEGANLLSELVLQRIAGLAPDYVGGLELGAVPLVTAVSMLSGQKGTPIPGFFVRKEVKGHGTKKLIEAAGDLSGKRIVVLDDVTTSGGSAMKAVEAVQAQAAQVVLVLAIVDRGEGAAEFYAQRGIPFDCLFHVDEFLAATA